jgi:hypothetical protein
MTDSTNPVETSMDMQPRSLPTRPYTSTRCYVTNSCVGKSVHLLLGQTKYYDKYTGGINFKSERVGLKYLIKAVKGCDIIKVITMKIPLLALTTNVHQVYSKTELVQMFIYDCDH